MSSMKGVEHLKVSLEEIKLATNNFGDKNLIAKGGFGNVYIGKLTISEKEMTVALKRLDSRQGQGYHEFLMEIQMLSQYKHENLVSLVGFCDDIEEKILVYEYVKHGSLDRYLSRSELSWVQRLKISLGAARGLSYLHNDVGGQHRVLHRDIKSSNILLNECWEAKISDFGLSKIGPANMDYTFLVTLACGTFGYADPQYVKTGIITKESDVYSFGVVLFELLCGRLAIANEYHDERRSLVALAQETCHKNKLYDVVFSGIKDEIKLDSLNIFSTVAYDCLKDNRSERPTMDWIVEKLKRAYQIQVSSKIGGFVRVGTWGKQSGGSEDNWSFELEQGHKLQRITIYHGDVISSLDFTTECRGTLHPPSKARGFTGGETASEVTFDFDEEIVGINGTIGTQDGDTIISSLSFKTNKRTHGPFGKASNYVFSVPFEKGSFAGFYGLAADYINSIGVYVKPYEEIARVGTWGSHVNSTWGSHINLGGNNWLFQLEKSHHLNKITIDHGDLIYSLLFTATYRGVTESSGKVGGWNGGDIVSEVTLEWDEEINGMSGTVAQSRGTYAGYTIISSISFVTNKRTYGPFGNVRGTPFSLTWDKGSFVGFYGLCGYYIDGIGVYLKTIVDLG